MPLTLSEFVNERILIQIDDDPNNDNFRTLVLTFAQGFAEFLSVINNIENDFDILGAEGDQLDKLGAWLNVPRSGFDDDQYRINLKIQILIIKSNIQRDANGLLGNWNGTVNNVLAIIREFIGPGIDPIVLTQLPPYSFKVIIPGALTPIEIQTLFQFIKRTIYAGVLGYTIFLFGLVDNLWAHGIIAQHIVISVNEAQTIFTDITAEFDDLIGGDNFEPFISEFAVDAACYFGFKGPFPSLYFDHTGGVDGDPGLDILWQYWNGATWVILPGVIDGTDSFRSSDTNQTVSWDIPSNWNSTTVNGSDTFFFVRAYMNNGGAGDSPTYQNGIFSGSDMVPFGLWDSGAIPEEALWAHGIQELKVFSSNGTDDTFVDLTSAFKSSTTNDCDFFVVQNSWQGKCYFGCLSIFDAIAFRFAGGTQGTLGTGIFHYWNGSTWTFFVPTSDGTNFFKANNSDQLLSFIPPIDWEPTSVNGSDPLYFIRAFIGFGSSFGVRPKYTSGIFADLPETAVGGVWDEGAVAGEGFWSGALSTSGGGIVISNDNT